MRLLPGALFALVPVAALAVEPAIYAPLADRSLLIDGSAMGNRVVVVGERGHVLISDDEGASWRQASVPTQALLTALHAHDENTGWAVGHDATVLKTENGGETWRIVHRAPEEELPLLDVLFVDESTGFAVGAYGYFLSSTDGGETWTSKAVSEDDFHLNAIVSAPGGNLYVAAEAGIAYRSEDGGTTWTELAPPYSGSWFDVLAPDERTVILAGLRGRMMRSDDAGESWAEVETGTKSTLTSIRRHGANGFLATGLEGTLVLSRDGGRTASLRVLPSRAGVSASLQLGSGRTILLGEFGARPLQAFE